jgi:hypothetical protein
LPFLRVDHAVTKDDGEKVNRVTGVYVRSKRMNQKRNVRDGIVAELRRNISEPVEARPALQRQALLHWAYDSRKL